MIKLLPITVTLPGIAGLILTIGVAADSNIVIFERIKEEVRAGRSMLSAISEGYRKGIATIIDANVITLLTAFILFGLATAGRQGLRASRSGSGRSSRCSPRCSSPRRCSALLGRSQILRSPALPRRQRRGHAVEVRLHPRLEVVLLDLGRDPRDRRDRVRDQAAQPRDRLRVGDPDPGRAGRGRRASTRSATRSATAGIDERRHGEDPGGREPGVRRERDPDLRRRSRPTRRPTVADRCSTTTFGLESGDDELRLAERSGPTFGEQIARKALIAIIFSLLVISAYVAIRFEAKYAVPVLIALIHDILITARHLRPGRPGGDERDRRRLPDHPRLLDVRHDHRLRPHPRERAADAARRVLADRQPLDERGPDPVADHRPLDRLPDRGAARLRRRDAAGLRLRDDGRGRLRYLLVDLHRRAGADRVEGARARLPLAPRADPRGDGLRADLPRGQRGRQDRRGRAPRRRAGRRRRTATAARPSAPPEPRRGAGRGRRAAGRARGAASSRPPRRRATGSPAAPRPAPSGHASAPSAGAARSSRGAGASTGGAARWQRWSGSRPGSRSGTSRSSPRPLLGRDRRRLRRRRDSAR